MDLSALFEGLGAPPDAVGGVRYSAVPIPGYERHRLGRDSTGAPTLLIAVGEEAPGAWPPPITLEHLTVQHDLECRVLRPDRSSEVGRFTVVRCADASSSLQVFFLRVGGAIVSLLGHAPTQEEINGAIESLVELFRSMVAPARKSVQGLWAELILIARSANPDALVNAWHALPGDRYDFNAGIQRIEVKSASGRVRQHYFALDQLSPVEGTDVLIASVLVERAGGGTSISDLMSEVRVAIDTSPRLQLRVEEVVTQTLGESWTLGVEERFDRQLAEKSLLLFEPGSIPSMDPHLPAGVSEVRFRVDLTGVTPIDPGEYRARGGLFQAVLRH